MIGESFLKKVPAEFRSYGCLRFLSGYKRSLLWLDRRLRWWHYHSLGHASRVLNLNLNLPRRFGKRTIRRSSTQCTKCTGQRRGERKADGSISGSWKSRDREKGTCKVVVSMGRWQEVGTVYIGLPLVYRMIADKHMVSDVGAAI